MEGVRRGLAILQNKLQKGLKHMSKEMMSVAHYLSLNNFEVTERFICTSESNSQHDGTELFTKTKLPEIFYMLLLYVTFPLSYKQDIS